MRGLLFSLVMLASTQAHARDSLWLLCESDDLVVNAFEHRGPGFDERTVSYTLIYGGHVLQGDQLDTTDVVHLTAPTAEAVREFEGFAWLNFQTHTLKISGSLNLYGDVQEIKKVMTCTEKN